MDKEQENLYKAVDEILWNDWDPIGVHEVVPRDEYQSYVPQIFSMLIHNNTEDEIAEKLYKIETQTIGVLGNREHCLNIAKKLIDQRRKTHHNIV